MDDYDMRLPRAGRRVAFAREPSSLRTKSRYYLRFTRSRRYTRTLIQPPLTIVVCLPKSSWIAVSSTFKLSNVFSHLNVKYVMSSRSVGRGDFHSFWLPLLFMFPLSAVTLVLNWPMLLIIPSYLVLPRQYISPILRNFD